MFHSHTGSRGLALQSHSTLYLAEGAVLLGGLRVYDVENVTIRGFGIIATTFLPGQYTALLLFPRFSYENSHFTKTGSGQVYGKLKTNVTFPQVKRSGPTESECWSHCRHRWRQLLVIGN